MSGLELNIFDKWWCTTRAYLAEFDNIADAEGASTDIGDRNRETASGSNRPDMGFGGGIDASHADIAPFHSRQMINHDFHR